MLQKGSSRLIYEPGDCEDTQRGAMQRIKKLLVGLSHKVTLEL
jgi:hypothetical protein